MTLTGHCYCGALAYEVSGDPFFAGQCHCRECQYLTGGGPNYTIGFPDAGFKYTSGTPKVFRRTDLETPVAREFCGDCGTPILSRAPTAPGMVLLKVGSLDDPKQFTPAMAIYTVDRQPFHMIPDDMPSFERLPG